MSTLTTALVWQELEKNLFAVLGMVTPQQEARTVGIVYIARRRKLYISSQKEAWKVRHITRNPHVSLTVPIHKSVPVMPWIKVPAATITFAGIAQVVAPESLDAELRQALFKTTGVDDAALADAAVIVVEPTGDFVTYGIGVSLMDMRYPEKARGRVAVLG